MSKKITLPVPVSEAKPRKRWSTKGHPLQTYSRVLIRYGPKKQGPEALIQGERAFHMGIARDLSGTDQVYLSSRMDGETEVVTYLFKLRKPAMQFATSVDRQATNEEREWVKANATPEQIAQGALIFGLISRATYLASVAEIFERERENKREERAAILKKRPGGVFFMGSMDVCDARDFASMRGFYEEQDAREDAFLAEQITRAAQWSEEDQITEDCEILARNLAYHADEGHRPPVHAEVGGQRFIVTIKAR